MIVEDILKTAEAQLKERTVADVVIGLGYTAVKLDDSSCGLAATLRDELRGECTLVERAGGLTGGPAWPLAGLVLSTDIVESAVGLATLNASLNREVQSNTAEPIEALQITDSDVVGMVGYFRPLVEPIKQKCRRLYIFERRPIEAESIYPDWAVNTLLPDCSIVIISATTLLNKTLDHILSLCRGMVALLGPSTPLSAELGLSGISFAFGSVVRDADKVMKIAAQGGGTKSFGAAVEKVNLRLDTL